MEEKYKPDTNCRVVFIVEDDPDIRDAYAALLEGERYETRLARDGQEALELLEGEPAPCLILLDLMMPRMDGFQFLEAVRKDEKHASIPIVVVSAYSQYFPRIAGKAAGFLKKPVDPDDLLKWVQNFCD